MKKANVLVHRLIEASPPDFHSILHQVYLSGYEDYDKAELILDWSVDIEYRSYGIKSIRPVIYDALLRIYTPEGVNEFVLRNDGWDIDYVFSMESTALYVSVYPTDCSVDWLIKKAVVKFGNRG